MAGMYPPTTLQHVFSLWHIRNTSFTGADRCDFVPSKQSQAAAGSCFMCEWYQYSHLSLRQKVNKCTSKNVGLSF